VSTAREAVLGRIRAALADRPTAAPIPRDYQGPRDTPGDPDLFAERVADYRASVHRAPLDEIGPRIAAILAERGRSPVLVPEGLPGEWISAVAAVPDHQLSTYELDAAAGVLTRCAVAVAETGTIVVDHGPGQGRRALTLVPDYHLVVVLLEQICANVPDAIARLDPSRPLTWISGPSATSDIELNRVEGVHGPRTLDVLIAG
jgi:L-lactate dehydrogenase complex protein LldG